MGSQRHDWAESETLVVVFLSLKIFFCFISGSFRTLAGELALLAASRLPFWLELQLVASGLHSDWTEERLRGGVVKELHSSTEGPSLGSHRKPMKVHARHN